jgi:hypothetical protein
MEAIFKTLKKLVPLTGRPDRVLGVRYSIPGSRDPGTSFVFARRSRDPDPESLIQYPWSSFPRLIQIFKWRPGHQYTSTVPVWIVGTTQNGSTCISTVPVPYRLSSTSTAQAQQPPLQFGHGFLSGLLCERCKKEWEIVFDGTGRDGTGRFPCFCISTFGYDLLTRFFVETTSSTDVQGRPTFILVRADLPRKQTVLRYFLISHSGFLHP